MLLAAAGREVVSKTSAYNITKLSYRVEVRVRYDGRGFDSPKGPSIFHSFCKHPTECVTQGYSL